MVIGVDVDGVVVDFNTAFIKLVKEETGVICPDNPPKEWSYHRTAGVTAEQDKAIWAKLAEDQDWWENLGPLPGAGLALDKLADFQRDQHSVYFITSQPRTVLATMWSLSNLGYSLTPNVIVSKYGGKGEIAEDVGLDVMIDDKPENLFDVKESRSECHTILIKAPYNAWSHDGKTLPASDKIDMLADNLGHACYLVERLIYARG